MNASTKLLHRLSAATVGLHANVPESHPSTLVLGTEREGTGVVVEPSKLVLTVNYTVLGAQSVSATFTDGSSHEAKLVAQDFTSGLAVLDCGAVAGGLHPRRSSELALGSDVAIIASTGGEERRIGDGVLSSLAPFEANWEFTLERALGSTAQNPGYGGAPMCDVEGTLLGLTFLDLAEIGRFSLGIPVDHFMEHEDELIQHGRRVSQPARAWIGCFCYAIRDHVVITGVMPNAPAARAGLKAGDVVLQVNGEDINDRRQLYALIAEQRPGGELEFRIYRDQGVRMVKITAGNVEEFFA